MIVQPELPQHQANVEFINMQGKRAMTMQQPTIEAVAGASAHSRERRRELKLLFFNTAIAAGFLMLNLLGAASAATITTTSEWHPAFNVPIKITEPGLTTELFYNDLRQLIRLEQTDTTTHTSPYSTSGSKRIWTYTYSAHGLISSIDGPLPGPDDTVSYTYNNKGQLQSTTNELGHVVTMTAWNALGQPTSLLGIDNVVTTYAYDDMGRPTSIIVNPGSSQTAWSITYTPAGDLASLSQPNGTIYDLTWDDARRLTTIRNNLGESITYSRDDMGNEIGREVAAADGTPMFTQAGTFDELGRIIKQVGGRGRTWSFAYDKTSNLTSITDPRSKTVTYGYDALNRLIMETKRDGGVIRRGYNDKDEEITNVDPRNLSTNYVRNGFGDIIQEMSPDRGTTIFYYNARGLMISKTDARNVTVNYRYDAAGRLIGRAYPSEVLNETFTYDEVSAGAIGKGRLTSMKDAAGSSRYFFDSAGRVSGEIRTIGSANHTVSYTYDASGSGRLISMTYPSGRIISYGYDALGRTNYVGLKNSATSIEQQIVSWVGYFPFGPVRGISFGNGLNMWSNRSTEYRLDGLFLDQASGGPSLVERYHYIGDGWNLTVLNNDTIAPAETQRFSYDDTGRLLTATGPYGSLSYTYDIVGNRLSEVRTISGAITTQSYAYPATSRLRTHNQ